MLAGAAATAALSIPRVAHGKGTTGNDFIQDLSGVVSGYEKNEEGDAKIYTPKARVDGAGSKSSLLLVYSPTPGPISNEDFVDALWLKDERRLVHPTPYSESSWHNSARPGAIRHATHRPRHMRWRTCMSTMLYWYSVQERRDRGLEVSSTRVWDEYTSFRRGEALA